MSPISFFVAVGILSCCVEIHSLPADFYFEHLDSKRQSAHHPFPEMNRFLNSHSRIHRQSSKPSYSFLGYLCSLANDKAKIDEILNTFGRNYGSLIMTIIKTDCPKHHRRPTRTVMSTN